MGAESRVCPVADLLHEFKHKGSVRAFVSCYCKLMRIFSKLTKCLGTDGKTANLIFLFCTVDNKSLILSLCVHGWLEKGKQKRISKILIFMNVMS